MTDTEITERAARDVMGWHIAYTAWFGDDSIFPKCQVGAFDPLHDWKWAGLLVEKMKEKGYNFMLAHYGEQYYFHFYYGAFTGFVWGPPYDSAPRAITTAAVKVVGKERRDDT